MKRIFFIIVTGLLTCQALAQFRPALSYSNYGPVAFDSFWRIPTVTTGYEQLTFSTFSRVSYEDLSGNFFTQFFRVDVPIGAENGLSVRMPLHRFNVGTAGALQRGMVSEKGTEWGDIDIIFTINAFRSFFDRWAGGKFNLLFLGEMHTAPTSSANRQFTDTLKMLGLMGFTGTWTLGTGELRAALFMGGGGWQDDELPRQNHIFKASSSVTYKRVRSSKWDWGVQVGNTVLIGEKSGDDGFRWHSSLFMQDGRNRVLRAGFGVINYTEGSGGSVGQLEFGMSFPIWFTGFKSVEAFRE